MKISLITVTRNSVSTIRDTFDSILNQTYPHIESIVIDGVSTDSTLEVIKEFEPKFNGRMKWISEPDAGIYDAMNKGLKMVTGDIVGILNSDDFYPNQHVIANVVNHFHQHNCEAIYGDLLYVDKEDVNKVYRYWKSGKYKSNLFKWGWMPPHPTFFCKRTVYEKHGSFIPNLKSAADYEFLLRVIHKEKIKIAYFPHIIVKMRIGGRSNISFKNRLIGNKEDRKAWKINNITPFFFTFLLKPVRKISQFF
jgi:glycosyltransferase